mmetsp:Transcript_80631/g.98771  ORF Transcript_80631/g.98771 Transcript_80631/m.98771 type:complete len:212 (-) Transcript_80631:23-658(-)
MASYIVPKCLIIDAKDHVLGRLASTAAKHLMMGTKVIILRSELIVIAGHLIRNRLKMKSFRRTRMNTNPRKGPFHYSQPSRMLYRVIRGMIPHKTPRGKACMRLLRTYDGIPPRFMHIKKLKVIPAYRHIKLDPSRPYTKLGNLMSHFGWKHAGLIKQLSDKRKVKLEAQHKIVKEITKLRDQAVINVAKKLKSDYEFLKEYEWNLPANIE